MIRFGLCCMFRDQPIKFRTTTAAAVARMKRADRLVKVSSLCLANADALLASLQFCADNAISCFRISSQSLPLKTHPDCGYDVNDLPERDVHHHRCNRDEHSEEVATELALATWDREPLFHVSSPIDGWTGPKPERHHDFLDVQDFPIHWLGLDVTVEIEAKAKEVAVLKLNKELDGAQAGSTASKWYVYMVRCVDGSLYTGIAKNVSRRCREHNAGTGSRCTRSRLPVRVEYQEVQADRSLASQQSINPRPSRR